MSNAASVVFVRKAMNNKEKNQMTNTSENKFLYQTTEIQFEEKTQKTIDKYNHYESVHELILRWNI